MIAALWTVNAQPAVALCAAVSAGICGLVAWRHGRASVSMGVSSHSEPRAAGLTDLAPLLEGMPDPALLIDADGRIAGSNAAARRQMQFEAAGLFLSSILRHPDLLDAVQAAIHDAATRTVEYEIASQVEQRTRCYVAPVTWGEKRAALMVFHDQTARISTERMRADFLANASHELRTPLASLTLLIETLAGPARDEPVERDRFLRMMQVQAERMRRLIDDLLSLSRIELDEHVPPSDRADLSQVAREVVDTLTPVAAERQVRLKLIEPSARPLVVGERFQLAQVVQNLVDNAVKYSDPGGEVEIEIGLADSREDVMAKAGRRWEEAGRIALLTPAPAPNRAYAYVRVTDAGPGVARRFLPRLGERFFRVEREMGAEEAVRALGSPSSSTYTTAIAAGCLWKASPARARPSPLTSSARPPDGLWLVVFHISVAEAAYDHRGRLEAHGLAPKRTFRRVWGMEFSGVEAERGSGLSMAAPVVKSAAGSIAGAPVKVSARDVNVFYGEKQALFDVSIDIPDGAVTAFIGPSGCGKTTFLRCINRMNDTIDNCRITGSLEIEGKNAYARNVDPVVLRTASAWCFKSRTRFRSRSTKTSPTARASTPWPSPSRIWTRSWKSHSSALVCGPR